MVFSTSDFVFCFLSGCLFSFPFRAIPNRNSNLKTSKALLKSQAHQGTSLFTSAATNQRVFSKRVVKRSSGPISRASEGDRVTVKVGVVQMGRVNDQIGSSILLPTHLSKNKRWNETDRQRAESAHQTNKQIVKTYRQADTWTNR